MGDFIFNYILSIYTFCSSTATMDYNWLTSGCDHDPMTIDANLAEIDFDDFKNEDIQNAYAFSLQSYVSSVFYSIQNTNLKPGYNSTLK